MPNLDALRLDAVQLVKDHNSYELAGPSQIDHRLAITNVIELDLWAAGRGDWWVSHSIPLGAPLLSSFLARLRSWRAAHPGHELLILNLDFKTDWLAGSGKGELETLLRRYFPENDLFRPIDLKGHHATCRSAARAGSWPTFGALAGRVMVVLTGGAAGRHNQHLSSYVKAEIIAGGYRGACFVAPDVDDADDVFASGGDLDGINREKNHVVVFNARWGYRAKFDPGTVRAQNLLLWFWDVPPDGTNMSAAVQTYQASVIGSTRAPEAIAATYRRGARGRDLGRPLVTFFEDDDGWRGHGDVMELGLGRYDNKGHLAGVTKLPGSWNDEVRALRVPAGVTVFMTDRDSFQSGGKGTVTVVGPRTVNIKDVADDPGLAGKVSSIEVRRS